MYFERVRLLVLRAFKAFSKRIIENDADSFGIFLFPASIFSLSIIPYHPSTKCGYNLFLEVTLWLFMR